MKKTIGFVNRTKKQLYLAYEMLKKRYRHVEFLVTCKNCLLSGYFIVQGNGVRHLKY